MANYDSITGYITNIYEGETQNGSTYLGIKFDTFDAHDNDTGRWEIRWWFTDGAMKITQDKVARLCEMAGVPCKTKPKTIAAALKLLSNEAFVALEIPVQVTPNEYDDKVYAQYELGWGDGITVVSGGFDQFRDVLAERMAAIKAEKEGKVYGRGKEPVARPAAGGSDVAAYAPTENIPASVEADQSPSSVYDEDIPF